MFRKSILFIAAVSVSLLFARSASAQKVGLVLSGGGAKGLYHIGVIQALEENGVPIDYVAGTSMGSIIAGLYAAGYSPEQMREIVASGDVKRWVSGRIDDSHRYYYREQDTPPAIIGLRFDVSRESRLRRRAAKEARSSVSMQRESRLARKSQQRAMFSCPFPSIWAYACSRAICASVNFPCKKYASADMIFSAPCPCPFVIL